MGLGLISGKNLWQWCRILRNYSGYGKEYCQGGESFADKIMQLLAAAFCQLRQAFVVGSSPERCNGCVMGFHRIFP